MKMRSRKVRRPSGIALTSFCSDQLRHRCGQQLCQPGVTLASQVHEVHLVELALGGIHKVHALPLGYDAQLLGDAAGFLHAACTHDGIVEEGNHEELLEKHGIYDQFYRMANELK